MLIKPNFRKLLIFAMLLMQLFSRSDAWAQGGFLDNTLLKTVKIGPHPVYTRILVDLNRSVDYQVSADFAEKRIILTLPDTQKGPRVRSKAFNDKNLEQFIVSTREGKIKITFVLKNSNTRFFHSMNPDKPQIIIDLKGNKKPILKAKLRNPPPSRKVKTGGKGQEKTSEIERPLSRKKVRVSGYTPKKIREMISQNEQEKVDSGWEDYQKALKDFQSQNYPVASKSLQEFIEKFPKSKYLGQALYLRAEAEYRKTFKELNPNFDRALAAYQAAMRKDPDSKFYDHALLKVATIYDEIGYLLEARTLYNQGIKASRKSLYNETRQNHLAAMLMKEEKFKEAFDAFQRILKKSPKNIDAKAGIFEIANRFFEKNDYDQALEIFETGAKRWPTELNEKPEINYKMAEIYFSQEKYSKARKHFFNLLNLDPTSENAHSALNRIGDTYLLQGNYQKALAVFDESSKKKVAKLDEEGKPLMDEQENVILEDSADTQYGRIRMADIGIRSPRLKVNDIVFDVSYYYKPFKTYEQIFQEAKNVEILAEVTLSRGIAYLLEQNYLKAIEEFKKLFPLGPESRFSQEAERFVKQALIALIDKYSKQKGMLPILYSYSDFVSLPIKNIKNAKTLLQVGEAYQAIGMYPEAIKFYEKVKLLDTEKTYRDRIFLNLGKIHLEEKSFDEAIMVGRSFTKNFPRSKRLNEAKKLLAQAHQGNGNLRGAITMYEELLGLSKDKAEIHYLIAEAKTEMKKYAEAAVFYQNAIAEYDRTERVVPDYIQKSYYHLGTSLFRLERYKAAIEALNAAKELFPDHPLKEWADYLLIDSYEQQGDLEKSKEGISRLVKAENADPILKRAAQSSADIQEWEKQLKEG
ncbi:MAG: tetratricopeptide repeat protein [Nitrospinota bacterium]